MKALLTFVQEQDLQDLQQQLMARDADFEDLQQQWNLLNFKFCLLIDMVCSLHSSLHQSVKLTTKT